MGPSHLSSTLQAIHTWRYKHYIVYSAVLTTCLCQFLGPLTGFCHHLPGIKALQGGFHLTSVYSLKLDVISAS